MKTVTINGIQIPVSEIKKVVKEHPELLEEPKRQWQPEVGEEYWYNNCYGTEHDAWDGDDTDHTHMFFDNVYKNEAEAAEGYKYLKAKKEILDYIYENDLALVDVDWGDMSVWKHTIDYNNGEKEYHCYGDVFRQKMDIPIMKSNEASQKLIDNMKPQLDIIKANS